MAHTLYGHFEGHTLEGHFMGAQTQNAARNLERQLDAILDPPKELDEAQAQEEQRYAQLQVRVWHKPACVWLCVCEYGCVCGCECQVLCGCECCLVGRECGCGCVHRTLWALCAHAC